MQIIYPDIAPQFDSFSIYLAGPTPRDPSVISWRTDALNILIESKFDGNVFVPERSSWKDIDYISQVEWEYQAMRRASKIIFWVPRDIETLPGFTTNIEFGFYMARRPNSVRYGRPDNAPNTRYLDWLYHTQTGRTPKNTLRELLIEAKGEKS